MTPEPIFDLVQHMLGDPRRRTQQGTDRKHIGASIYRCGVCGGPPQDPRRRPRAERRYGRHREHGIGADLRGGLLDALPARVGRRTGQAGRIDHAALKALLIQQPRDLVRVVWNHHRLVAEGRLELVAVRRRQLIRVVLVDVIRVLQQVPCQHRHDVGVRGNHPGRPQLANPRQRCLLYTSPSPRD